MQNQTMLQGFEWYLPENGCLWSRWEKQAQNIAALGITDIWLPPAYKGANGAADVGYGVYDLFDLGEFDQKGTVRTKYGTRESYLAAVRTLRQAGVRVWADIVMNHKMGADELEHVRATPDASDNREKAVGDEREIAAWTKFTFPGRAGKYSGFQWNWTHFNGTDWDDGAKTGGIYLFEGKQWDEQVDPEHGNFDYLMGADLALTNHDVVEELKRWGCWYLDTVHPDGLRLDAVKHMQRDFYTDWLGEMRRHAGRELPAVGEYWSPEVERLLGYLEGGAGMRLFDVPLHFHLFDISGANGNYDLSKLLDGTLVQAAPDQAVTFVDNHDTQPGQALQTFIQPWFKAPAYALILLRGQGLPCVFYGDLYGVPHDGIAPVAGLKRLLWVRANLAYGELHDYFDDANVVGFTREGDAEHPDSGLAMLLSDSTGGEKRMYVGSRLAGKTLVDALGKCTTPVTVDGEGNVTASAPAGGAAVWVTREAFDRMFMEES